MTLPAVTIPDGSSLFHIPGSCGARVAGPPLRADERHPFSRRFLPRPSLRDSMLLADLVDLLSPEQVHGSCDRLIQAVTRDSRRAGPLDVFVAIPGNRVDGRRFVPGLQVAAVIAEDEVSADPGVTVLIVADARKALGLAAAAVAGHPAQELPVVGLTGTNGKTTTAWLLDGLAREAGWTTGLIGTAGHHIAGQPIETQLTTPEAPEVQGLLRQAADSGCRFVVMEASSIGIAQERVTGISFEVAGFTSFGRDHLGFHGSLASYFGQKLRLFVEHASATGTAVVNIDSAEGRTVAEHARSQRVWTTSVLGPADLTIEDLVLDLDGARGTLVFQGQRAPFSTRLLGEHNVANGLLAIGCAHALGMPLSEALAGLARVEGVPGRLEAVPNDTGITVLVDYAHTPDALERVLATLRPLTSGRILTVVGCGGDRDRGKRPLMAAAAEAGSDVLIITSDNPRSEDPADIVAEMVPGLHRPAVVDLDRTEAVYQAIARAEPGDVVLIAGKGHEKTQESGGVVRPFSDVAVAAEALGAPLPSTSAGETP